MYYERQYCKCSINVNLKVSIDSDVRLMWLKLLLLFIFILILLRFVSMIGLLHRRKSNLQASRYVCGSKWRYRCETRNLGGASG